MTSNRPSKSDVPSRSDPVDLKKILDVALKRPVSRTPNPELATFIKALTDAETKKFETNG